MQLPMVNVSKSIHRQLEAVQPAILGNGAKTYQLKKPDDLERQKFMKAFAYLLQRMGGRCLLLKQTKSAKTKGIPQMNL